ncbi:MAG: 50S ribosomal protein L22 [Planctomycetes bacterium]|nr:50S ribosomal protein L22 [Planctomycetota bacterium]
MPYQASHQYAKVTPRKARPIADLVRGQNASRALEMLNLNPRRACGLFSTVIASAMANASQHQGVNLNKLVIREIFVNEGPLVKRGRPVARGRYHRIMKKMSHLHVVLDDPDAKPDRDADGGAAESAKKDGAKKPAATKDSAGGRV